MWQERMTTFKKLRILEIFFLVFSLCILNDNEPGKIKPGGYHHFGYCQPNPYTYFYQNYFFKKIIFLINVS